MTDATEPGTDLSTLVATMREAGRSFAALQDRVESGAPWPLSHDIGTSPESHWGPPEVLAHVAEMLPFWTGEIERILAAPEEPFPFGRVATNALRIGVIERDRSLPPRELFSRIEASIDRLGRRLEGLSAADVARRGVHPTLGEMSLPLVMETFVARHLEDHVRQLQAELPGELPPG